MIFSFILELLSNGFRFCGPVFLRLLVLSLENGEKRNGYLYALALFLSQIGASLTLAHGKFYSFSVGLRIKNAISSIVFKELLALKQNERSSLESGRVINLVSTDASVFVELMRV